MLLSRVLIAIIIQSALSYAAQPSVWREEPLRKGRALLQAAVVPTLLSSGDSHTCALASNGQVKCWGSNGFGQLGLGDYMPRGDGANEMGASLPTVQLGMVSVQGHTATYVSAAGSTSCVILDDTTLKCWGLNAYGQLGLGDDVTRGDNPGQMGDYLPVVNLGTGRKAKFVAGGGAHTCAILDDNTVKCWGNNDIGQLGQGHTRSIGDQRGEMGGFLRPVDLGIGRTAKALCCGADSTCVILDDGSVKCWGDVNDIAFGFGDGIGQAPGQMGDNLPVVRLGTGRTAKSISCGARFTCATLDDNSLKCWGSNENGSLGTGDERSRGLQGGNDMGDNLLPVDLGTGRSVISIACGSSHVCTVLDDATVRCWGANSEGQLGLGNTESRGALPTDMGKYLRQTSLGTEAVMVSAGSLFSCVLLNDDRVKCWGSNLVGELGIGNSINKGDDPAELGSLRDIQLWQGMAGTGDTPVVTVSVTPKPTTIPTTVTPSNDAISDTTSNGTACKCTESKLTGEFTREFHNEIWTRKSTEPSECESDVFVGAKTCAYRCYATVTLEQSYMYPSSQVPNCNCLSRDDLILPIAPYGSSGDLKFDGSVWWNSSSFMMGHIAWDNTCNMRILKRGNYDLQCVSRYVRTDCHSTKINLATSASTILMSAPTVFLVALSAAAWVVFLPTT